MQEGSLRDLLQVLHGPWTLWTVDRNRPRVPRWGPQPLRLHEDSLPRLPGKPSLHTFSSPLSDDPQIELSCSLHHHKPEKKRGAIYNPILYLCTDHRHYRKRVFFMSGRAYDHTLRSFGGTPNMTTGSRPNGKNQRREVPAEADTLTLHLTGRSPLPL